MARTLFSVVLGVTAIFFAAVQVSTAQHVPCKWYEYYDDVMDNCGPCKEICQNMALTKTEGQCRTQCDEYLVAQGCTADQYYDDVVKNCAPCSEICNQREAKGTSQDCYKKCSKYLAKNSPGKDRRADASKLDTVNATSDQPKATSSGWLPGLLAAALLGVGGVAAIGTLVFYRRKKARPADYRPAPNQDTASNNDVCVPVDRELGPSVQESRESMHQPTSAVAQDKDGDQDLRYGMPEIDPYAPSSAAASHVRREDD